MRLQVGVVRYFNPVEGFGFISPTNGGEDIFVSRMAIAMPNKSLSEGQTVEFSTQSSTRGVSAQDVIVC